MFLNFLMLYDYENQETILKGRSLFRYEKELISTQTLIVTLLKQNLYGKFSFALDTVKNTLVTSFQQQILLLRINFVLLCH